MAAQGTSLHDAIKFPGSQWLLLAAKLSELVDVATAMSPHSSNFSLKTSTCCPQEITVS